MATPVIETKNLVKSFSIGNINIKALRGVSFSLYQGEFLIIYGPSGCGKSTLLNMISGLDEISSGSILINGKGLDQFSMREIIKLRRRGLGMVFQNYNLIPSISVLDNVALPLNFSNISKRERVNRAKEVLKAVNLADKIKRHPSELSGGEQQRVSIARAIVSNPPIILADEPTGNLDEKSGWEVMSILANLCRKYGRTVLLVTHNPAFFSLADRVLFMRNGKIVKQDTVPEKMKVINTQIDIPPLSYYVPSRYKNDMKLRDMIALAYKHFRYAKARTFLTILGITIGISAIILLVSLGFGLQNITTARLAGFDTLQTVNVTAGAQGPKLDNVQIDKIKTIKNVDFVSPTVNFVASGTLMSTTTSVTVTGYSSKYLEFEQVNLENGRTFSSDNASEAIVSTTALKALDIKDSNSVLNQKIKLNLVKGDLRQDSIEMTVVAVTAENTTPVIFVPLDSVMKFSQEGYSALNVKIKDRKEINSVAEQIDELGFNTSSTSDLIEQVDKVFLVIQVILGTIGGIALFVASFGIINTMTISLLERTHEIGIMKALGISARDIKRLFINEAGYFGFFGGILGVILGYLIGQFFNSLIYVLMKKSGETEVLIPFVTPWKFAVIIIIFAILLGRLAGYYPAWRASKLSPLEAFRHE